MLVVPPPDAPQTARPSIAVHSGIGLVLSTWYAQREDLSEVKPDDSEWARFPSDTDTPTTHLVTLWQREVVRNLTFEQRPARYY